MLISLIQNEKSAFVSVNQRPFCLSLLFVLFLGACALSTPPPTATAIPTLTAIATFTGFPVTAIPSPTATEEPFNGVIKFPFLNADAGNFQLQTGETITFTWEGAPAGAERYEFVIYPHDGSQPVILATDTDPSDGVAIQFAVTSGLAAELRGTAYFSDGTILRTRFNPSIYSAE